MRVSYESQLVMLLNNGHWNDTNSALKERFEEERPALRVELASPLRESGGLSYGGGLGIVEDEYRPEVLPVMFSDLFVRCHSQVAVYPINCPPFLLRAFK